MGDRNRQSYLNDEMRDNFGDEHIQSRSDSHSSVSQPFVFRGTARDGNRHRDNGQPANRWDDSRRPRDSYRPQEQFTFRAQGPPAPRFPSPDRRSFRTRRSESGRVQSRQHTGNGRSQRHHGPRYAFKRAANNREILNKSLRDTTPEQLQGMNDRGFNRFNLDIYHSEDSDSESGSSNTNPTKKIKREDVLEHKVPPQWSNPDPYTALPPPETLGAPKKDIVQVIRKAKVDSSKHKLTSGDATEEADFISFDFSNDNEIGISKVLSEDNVSERDTSRDDAQLARAEENRPGDSEVHITEKAATANLVAATQSNKRKRGPGGPSGDILDSWYSGGPDRAPWCSPSLLLAMNPALRLHIEICDFYAYVKPAPFEEAVRRGLIADIEEVIRASAIPHGQTITVRCFGSFAAGLYLPTADMDLVAVTPSFMNKGAATFCQSKSQLHRLGAALRRLARPGDLCVIASARVPIVKFTDQRSGIKVDMSVENRTGLDAVQTFEHWKQEYPAMPIIVVIIKQLLAMRGLNEVFRGGIGGFTIICLVTSMLQLMPEHQSGTTDSCASYGDLLLRFLDLYGNKFDVRRTGICLNPPGYFDKRAHPMPKQNDDRLTIMDPNDPSNDISGGSRLIETVFETFREAHARLQRRMADLRTGSSTPTSILDAILGGNYTAFEKQRNQLKYVHSRPSANPPLSAPRSAIRGGQRFDRRKPHGERPDTNRNGHHRFESRPRVPGGVSESRPSGRPSRFPPRTHLHTRFSES